MAPSRLADKCVDSAEAEWRTSVRTTDPFSSPPSPFFHFLLLFFLPPSHFFLCVFVFVFCLLPIERSQVAPPDSSRSPSRRAADVTAGLLNGQRDKSFIWRSSSPPPPPSSPPLCFLGRYAESLLAAVCVKGRKGGGEKGGRRSTACVFTSSRLCPSSGSQKKDFFLFF